MTADEVGFRDLRRGDVTTQDASQALVLSVSAQAQTTDIFSEPAVVRFAVVVSNIGQTDSATLTVKEAGTTVATIPSLPSGDSETLVFDLETSIAVRFSSRFPARMMRATKRHINPTSFS